MGNEKCLWAHTDLGTAMLPWWSLNGAKFEQELNEEESPSLFDPEHLNFGTRHHRCGMAESLDQSEPWKI